MKKKLLLFTLSLAAFSQAAIQTVVPAANRKPSFVLAEQLDIFQRLPAPPADPAADIAELKRIQATRTPAQIEQAKADDLEESMFIYTSVLGPNFTREKLPLTAQLSDHARFDISPVINSAKAHFKRPRPFHYDAEIKPVCKALPFDPNKGNYAYPSGHAGVGYIEALVLIQMVPEKKDAILARADQYAHNRVVCGVHYPSDPPASKATAYATIGLMMNNPFFRKELQAAKAELRSALGLQ